MNVSTWPAAAPASPTSSTSCTAHPLRPKAVLIAASGGATGELRVLWYLPIHRLRGVTLLSAFPAVEPWRHGADCKSVESCEVRPAYGHANRRHRSTAPTFDGHQLLPHRCRSRKKEGCYGHVPSDQPPVVRRLRAGRGTAGRPARERLDMNGGCTHLDRIHDVTPSSWGCEDCLAQAR